MMWRVIFIATVLATVGASAHAVPLVQAASTEPAAAAVDPVDPGNSAGRAAHKKVLRRCARRSRLGICERWNMPKSAQPATRPDPGIDARNPPAKH